VRGSVSTARGVLELAYLRAGEGNAERLLLLHGIGSNSGSFAAQLADLGDSFDLVAWDAPGYGGSSDPPPDYSMADFADAAAGLLDLLGWQAAHVLGHSFGGVIAQMLYLRHPKRVRSLILADTNAGSGSMPDASKRTRRRLTDLDQFGPRGLAERRAPNLLTPDAPAELVQQVTDIMAQIRPVGYSAAAIAMGATDLRDQLPRIGVPTLVLHGERDAVIPASTADALAAGIPRARLVTLRGVGHASNQQAPESYNHAVRAFLTTAWQEA
jgi:pimeloyl-ACP methyl ester carboxylesterase